MKRPNQNSKGSKPKFQNIWEKFKDDYKTEGYELRKVQEIYLPFWVCKQSVVVEHDVELDRFSRIILELLQVGVITHQDLCAFFGFDEDSFVTMQFHYLLKNDLMRNTENDQYEITHSGIEFLKGKKKIKSIDTVEFEYFIIQRSDYLTNDLDQSFFNPDAPIDKQLSDGKKASFSGYSILETHKLHKTQDAMEIKHGNRPTINKVKKLRNEFSAFYNTMYKEQQFYDFTDDGFEAHKRNIAFFALIYENKENMGDVKVEIRHSKKSVKQLADHQIEKKLTELVTANYLSDSNNFKNNREVTVIKANLSGFFKMK